MVSPSRRPLRSPLNPKSPSHSKQSSRRVVDAIIEKLIAMGYILRTGISPSERAVTSRPEGLDDFLRPGLSISNWIKVHVPNSSRE